MEVCRSSKAACHPEMAWCVVGPIANKVASLLEKNGSLHFKTYFVVDDHVGESCIC